MFYLRIKRFTTHRLVKETMRALWLRYGDSFGTLDSVFNTRWVTSDISLCIDNLMIPTDRRLISDRRTPATRWSPEEVRILRAIADIQLDLSECTTQEERDALYLELQKATAQCISLAILPFSSNLEEEEIKHDSKS